LKEAVPPWIGYCFSKETHFETAGFLTMQTFSRKTKSLVVGAVAKDLARAVAKGLSDVIAALEYRVFVVFGSAAPLGLV